jgi:Tol biopolymer transport system component
MRRQGIGVAATLVIGLAAASTGQATFPGANGRIAVMSESKAIFSVEPDGSGLTQITTGTATADPAFSPDGKTLALVSKESGGLASSLVTVDAQGGDLEVIPGAKPASDPSFSASGTRIAYESKGAIKTVDLDGSHEKTVVKNVVGFAEFSPAGPKIAYVDETPHNTRNIFLIGANGKHRTQLTSIDKGWAGGPALSPDGKQIVYSVQTRQTELWVMDADGSHAHAITDTHGVDEEAPAFSPDGRQIAFGADGAIEMMDASGGTPVKVIDDSERFFEPSWQPLP